MKYWWMISFFLGDFVLGSEVLETQTTEDMRPYEECRNKLNKKEKRNPIRCLNLHPSKYLYQPLQDGYTLCTKFHKAARANAELCGFMKPSQRLRFLAKKCYDYKMEQDKTKVREKPEYCDHWEAAIPRELIDCKSAARSTFKALLGMNGASRYPVFSFESTNDGNQNVSLKEISFYEKNYQNQIGEHFAQAVARYHSYNRIRSKNTQCNAEENTMGLRIRKWGQSESAEVIKTTLSNGMMIPIVLVAIPFAIIYNVGKAVNNTFN